MKKKIKKAFTLGELIVSIIILIILGTISFLFFQGYSKNSRDSVRITDLGSIKKTFELFHINTGKYPLSSDAFSVTYSGGSVWNQGSFGDSTFRTIQRLNTLPIDPLTSKEYTYSILENRQEYELAGIIEGNQYTGWKNSTYADDQVISTIVTGNYNGEMVNINTQGESCLLAVPSIITSSGSSLEDIVEGNYFVYNNYSNLPSSYNSQTQFKLLGEQKLVLVQTDNVELYCGDYSQLENNQELRLEFIDNFQKAYSGTQVEKVGRIKEVLELSIDLNAPTPALKIYTIDFLEDELNLNISEEEKALANECNDGYHLESNICTNNIRQVSIPNGIGTQLWENSARGDIILSSCNSGYHTEDNSTCISNTGICSIENGTGINTWNGISWDCNVATCIIDYYNPGNNTCAPVEVGYYSNVTDTSRHECTNKPLNSIYNSDGNGLNNCNWSCDTGYTSNGASCIKNSWDTSVWSNCSTTSYWGSWSTCSQTCGGGEQSRTCIRPTGVQTRTVSCKDYNGNILPDTECIDIEPSDNQSCTANLNGCGGSAAETQSCNTDPCCASDYGNVCQKDPIGTVTKTKNSGLDSCSYWCEGASDCCTAHNPNWTLQSCTDTFAIGSLVTAYCTEGPSSGTVQCDGSCQ